MADTQTTADILGTGRRKTSVARVRLRPGSGKILINGRALEDFFCASCSRKRWSPRWNTPACAASWTC